MGKGFGGAVLRALGAKEHILTVTGKEHRTDHFIRVHLRSETLLHADGEAPGNWIRAWFPDHDGGSKYFQRGYTILEANPETGCFCLDFVVHEPGGPASGWAKNCETGDQIVAMRYGERPFELLDPPPAGYLFLGDLAAYPAISSLAEAIPAEHEVVVYLECHDRADRRVPLPQGPNITAAWVDELPDGQALVQAVDGRDWTDWYAWITGEAVSTRKAKTLLQRDFGLTKATMHPQAYWVRGRAMGKAEELDRLDAAARDESSALEAQPADEAPTAELAAPTPPASTPAPGILAPARPALWCVGVVAGLFSLLQIVPFLLFAEVGRLFLTGADRAQFVSVAVWAALILGVTTAGLSVLLLALHVYDARFSARLRRRLMDKLETLPLGWFSGRGSGEVKKLVGDDVAALHYVVVHAVVDAVGAVVAPLAVLIYLFAVQWRLGLVLLLPLVAYACVMVSITKRDAAKVVASQRKIAHSSSQMQAFIATNEISRVFGDKSVVDVGATLDDQADFIAAWQRETGPLKIVAVMVNRPTTVLGLLVLAGFAFIGAGWIPAADLIPFLIVGTSFSGQLMAVSTSVYGLYTGLQSRDGISLLLGTPSLPGPAHRPAVDGHVRFDHVRFGYGPDKVVLPDFDLALEPGTVTALVGPSGAGKSTVAALLARLWDPQSGAVSINGKDIRDLRSEELYAEVTILLQDVQLIHTSIRDNIALTRPDAPDEQIIAAAQAAHIHHRIAELPDGYDTVVGPDQLSGGERQRVGIARALLADTPIVVLDEATASADPDSEWAIQQGLDRLLRGKTVLMIAHRLHTVTGADRIVVMDDGRIAESGTHDELLATGGCYADLWHAAGCVEAH